MKNDTAWCSELPVGEGCGVVVAGRITCGDGIAAMVKELPESRAAVSSPCLLPINGVQRLVDEQTQRTEEECPSWSLRYRDALVHFTFATLHLTTRKKTQNTSHPRFIFINRMTNEASLGFQ